MLGVDLLQFAIVVAAGPVRGDTVVQAGQVETVRLRRAAKRRLRLNSARSLVPASLRWLTSVSRPRFRLSPLSSPEVSSAPWNTWGNSRP